MLSNNDNDNDNDSDNDNDNGSMMTFLQDNLVTFILF